MSYKRGFASRLTVAGFVFILENFSRTYDGQGREYRFFFEHKKKRSYVDFKLEGTQTDRIEITGRHEG
jgi:hypothetical protein